MAHLLFVLLLFPAIALASPDPAQIEAWSRDSQWRTMGHYKSGLFGEQGQADGKAFYLSKNGRADSPGELAETLRVFQTLKPPFEKASPLCRFPARYLWLKTKVAGLELDPLKECTDYREFSEKIGAKSVSLIFSSYFINTPASAFGHTFLRFNSASHREDNRDQAEILDYGINYAAGMDTANALVYAFKGIVGMYPGTFTAVPYYYKVREYNDFESRDLWEYKLRFTQPQIDLMVAHLWELGPTYFDYFYFTENCSYHILALLEVGDPALKMTDELPSLYVIPIDTVRMVSRQPGFIQGRRYRPSVLSRLEARSAKLDDREVERLRSLVEHPATAPEVTKTIPDPKTQAGVLEAAVEAFDFLHAHDLVFKHDSTNPGRHELLVTRSEVDYIGEDPLAEPALSMWPDQGHGSQRWGMMAGYRKGQGANASASMRFALHDLLDPLQGQPTFSEIIFAEITGRVQQTDHRGWNKLYLENLDFFRVSSFQPITHWQRAISWTARVGLKTVQDGACDQCLAGTIEVGAGATVAPKLSESFVSLLTKLETDYSDGFPTHHRIAVGPEIWWRWVPSKKWSMLTIVGYKWSNYFEAPLFSDQFFTRSVELRYHVDKDWSLAAKAQGYEKDHHAFSAGFYRYF